MKKGDIVIVPFPFTDLSSQKRRPACVLLNTKIDVVLAFISTKLYYEPAFSIRLNPSDENGLKRESIIRIDKIVTLDSELVIGKLGEISSNEILELNNKMISCYRLKNYNP
ncbi:MAG: type II toxin-antitoxin system PemK/MazF family toxin [Balneolaceae bacterium]|nr:MAG: type II toxin-antitoxin system PemK/MazF family toxin [Balneolaceae bacterium]